MSKLIEVISAISCMTDISKKTITITADDGNVRTNVMVGSITDIDMYKRLYGNYEASWTINNDNIFIEISGRAYTKDQKFLFDIGTSGGDGYSSGKIALTYEQAMIVEYACNKDNWTDFMAEYGDGNMSIDLDNPTPID